MSSFHPRAETIEMDGCEIVLRRVDGPIASELYLHGRPLGEGDDAGLQAESIHRGLLRALEAEGACADAVVSETVFLRDVHSDLAAARAARERVVPRAAHHPAVNEIEQPPLDPGALVEVSAHAIWPHDARPRVEALEVDSSCACAECEGARGLRVQVGPETRVWAGGVHASGRDAYAQALATFELAERLLQRAGMTFRDVVRTWIHLRDIDRDYDALNRARRAFFADRGIDPPPASTGIGGGPAAAGHAISLGLQALQSSGRLVRAVMTTPTLNEAPEYGADFTRGTRVEGANQVSLVVSGTASIDEAGRTAHEGDFDAQADRMLLNVAKLLEGQGAGFGDVVSAITYLKRAEDGHRLAQKLREAGFEGFPHALVVAPICRPELLCETEALAVLPVGAGA